MDCPLPISDYKEVLLAHGSGGTLMHDLIDKIFIAAFGAQPSDEQLDSAVVGVPSNKIAMTTDSYVIDPLFFPGGNIGSLAVHGTVNDLSMSGAIPLFLTCGFIIEEGFLIEDLWKVVCAMKRAADECGVKLVAGDTKVVDKGKADKLFINTSGVGIIKHNKVIAPSSVRKGDCILINGDIGRHGIAVMAEREGFNFDTVIESDSAPLNFIVRELLSAGVDLHCMRDLTRGGLASSLVEISRSANCHIRVNERDIPVLEPVEGACEILGFDPIYVANEGRFICFVPETDAEKALRIMKASDYAEGACMIGKVTGTGKAGVTLKSAIGTDRIVHMLSGQQLPRIC